MSNMHIRGHFVSVDTFMELRWNTALMLRPHFLIACAGKSVLHEIVRAVGGRRDPLPIVGKLLAVARVHGFFPEYFLCLTAPECELRIT